MSFHFYDGPSEFDNGHAIDCDCAECFPEAPRNPDAILRVLQAIRAEIRRHADTGGVPEYVEPETVGRIAS